MTVETTSEHDHEDVAYMRVAIKASWGALAAGDKPFGAVLVREGVSLHLACNSQQSSGDFSAHAEVVLLREASMKYGCDALRGTTVYASGEPCAMCTGAMFWAGVTRVVYGATNDDIVEALGEPSLKLRCAQLMAAGAPSVQVDGPILREEAVAVLQAFEERR